MRDDSKTKCTLQIQTRTPNLLNLEDEISTQFGTQNTFLCPLPYLHHVQEQNDPIKSLSVQA